MALAGANGGAGPLSLLEWVEVELQGFEELLEGLYRLRGAVMAVAVAMEERRTGGATMTRVIARTRIHLIPPGSWTGGRMDAGETAGGDGGAPRVKRRWFQGANPVWLVPYGSATVVSLGVLVVNREVWQVSAAMGVVLVVSAYILYQELVRSLPEEIVVGPSALESYKNGRLRSRIAYSPDVVVGIYPVRGVEHPRFGPMAGITMCEGGRCITCHSELGWELDDVRMLWEPLLAKAREFEMRIDPPMQRLIDRMEAGTVNAYFEDEASPS